MTNPYLGFPANAQNNLPGPVNIAGTTNATPIVVHTSTNHNLTTGSYIRVSGAADSNANGDWIASVVDPTHVALKVIPTDANSTGSMAGGAAGTVQDLSFGVAIPILSDGDDPQATLWNDPYEGLEDQSEYLLYVTVLLNDTVTSNYTTLNSIIPRYELRQTTLNPVNTGGGAIETYSNFNGLFNNSTVVLVDSATNAKVGDTVDVRANFDVSSTAVGSDWQLRLASVQDFGGANATAAISGATYYTQSTARVSLFMQGSFSVTTAGPLRVLLQVRTPQAGATLSNYGTGALIMRRDRVGP